MCKFCANIYILSALKNLKKSYMKKMIMIILAVSFYSTAFAQDKKISLEVGLNYPIGFQRNGNKENHIGFYANGAYKFYNSPLRANLKLSYDSYTVVKKAQSGSPYNGRSLSLIPSVNYDFAISSNSVFYAGVGAGLSIDNLDKGVFNEGNQSHFVFAPQIGFKLIKHINISAQYNITHKDYSRFMMGIGYIF